MAPGFSCSTACGIFSDQELNPCLLHWQADSLPLRHQGCLGGSLPPKMMPQLHFHSCRPGGGGSHLSMQLNGLQLNGHTQLEVNGKWYTPRSKPRLPRDP